MKRFLLSILGVFLSIALLSGDNYMVNTSVLNVRSSPDKNAAVLGALKSGEIVSAEATSDPSWYKIEYNGRPAYVASAYLEYIPAEPQGPTDGGQYSSYHIMGLVQEKLLSAGLPGVDVLLLLAVAAVLLLAAALVPGKVWKIGLVLLFLASCSIIYMVVMYMCNGVETGLDLNPLLSLAVQFVVLGLLVFGCSFAILKVMLNAAGDIPWAWGWLPWLLASVPVLVDYYHSWNIAGFVILGLMAYQAGFSIYALIRFVMKRRYFSAVPVVAVYLMSSLAATILISSFTVLFSHRIWI